MRVYGRAAVAKDKQQISEEMPFLIFFFYFFFFVSARDDSEAAMLEEVYSELDQIRFTINLVCPKHNL